MTNWLENLKHYALSDDMDYRFTWEDAAFALEEIERLQSELNTYRTDNEELLHKIERLRAALERISKRARQKWSEGKEDGWLWVYKTADEALRDE